MNSPRTWLVSLFADAFYLALQRVNAARLFDDDLTTSLTPDQAQQHAFFTMLQRSNHIH